MKKVLICNYKGNVISGAEKAIVDMILPIKNEIDFIMFVPSEGKLANFYRSNNLNVIVKRLSNKRRKYPGLHFIQSVLVSSYLKKEKFDLILCNTFYAAEKIATASKLSNVALAIYVREYFNLNNPSYKRNLNIAKKIFAVSSDVKDSLSQVHNDISVVHDYLNINLIEKSKQNNSVIPFNSKESKKVVIVGRITPYKQQDLFIESYFLVKEVFPNVEFYVIGEAAYNEKYFENSLKDKCKKFSNVHFLGNRNDVYDILPFFDVSCMVSDREPFPRTILESQYLQVPVVASDTGGAKEMIIDGVSGLSFDAVNKDPQLLADKILHYLNDTAFSDRIKQNAYNTLLKTYATNQPVLNFKNCIENAIKENL